MDLKEVGLIGSSQKSHWYYASKARALRKSLGGWQPHAILDVGAGTGYFARTLLQETSATSAVCVDPGYADERSEVDAGKPIAFRRSGEVGQSDLVLLMDVLEHIDDDVSFLRELVTSAEARTTFVISVPAFSWLWSSHDEFLGHRRRYTAGRLAQLITAAGLTPVRTFYMFAAVFPAVVVQRILSRWRFGTRAPKSDLREHHRWTNWALKQICLAECAVTTHNRAFGLTVFGVARKT